MLNHSCGALAGKVGSLLDLQFAMPASNSQEDVDAAERSNIFTFAWIADPLMTGDYPAIMREIVDRNSFGNGLTESRLPSFTDEEKRNIVGKPVLPATIHRTCCVQHASRYLLGRVVTYREA